MNWAMKILFTLLFLCACTQKYTDYDLIRKIHFTGEQHYKQPLLTKPVVKEGNDHLKACFNQWFFDSNAEARKNESIPLVIRTLCPQHDFLIDAHVEETWWTTIIFTRACAEVTASCGKIN